MKKIKKILILRSLIIGILLINVYLSKGQGFYINTTFSVGSSGDVAVFSDMELGADAQVLFQDGSTIHMLGTATTINSGAEIFANTTSTQSGTGRILFSGTAAQTLNGGNSSAIGGTQPSLINIALNNSNNLTLSSTNTRVTSGLDLISGHIILGNNNLELASAATITNANETKYVVTNGTGFLAKESFSSAFTFPVGRATSDFTPATVTPSASDNFFVQVKNYSESASDEVTSADGIDRTWNIYSTAGAAATLALQHNSGTNGTNYVANGDDAAAFVTQYQGINWVPYVGNQGTWELGTGAQGTNVAGSPSGSVIHSRVYSSTETSSTADGAFFSKSTLPLTPLPITLLDFTATKRNEIQSLLTWTTTSENNSSHFEVETSIDGELWTKIGDVKAQGNSYQNTNYQLVHRSPALGLNFYRLNMVDLDGQSKYSPIQSLNFGNMGKMAHQFVVYPNPVQGILTIHSENRGNTYALINMEGKVLEEYKNTSVGFDFYVDLSSYANGVYYIQSRSEMGGLYTLKIILTK